jgi:trimeric autotransporter adhesin
MATTTPNFGWAVPTSTDLVKDGAVAIETLGDSIDASLVDLKGGTTGQVLTKASGTDMDFSWTAVDPLVILDAKGDLITATAADTPARLAVGTNGQVLTADSTAATGIKWATAASGGMTVIASGTLSGTSVNLTSIPGTYKHLQLVMWGTTFSANDGFALQYNGVTASNYARSSYGQNGATSVNGSVINDNGIYYGNGAADPLFSSSFNHWVLDIYDYTNTVGALAMRGNGTYLNTSSVYSTYQAAYTYVAATATAITSLNIKTGGSRTMAGNYILYGVN